MGYNLIVSYQTMFVHILPVISVSSFLVPGYEGRHRERRKVRYFLYFSSAYSTQYAKVPRVRAACSEPSNII